MILPEPPDILTRRTSAMSRPRQTARKAVLTLPSQEASVPVTRRFTDHLLRH